MCTQSVVPFQPLPSYEFKDCEMGSSSAIRLDTTMTEMLYRIDALERWKSSMLRAQEDINQHLLELRHMFHNMQQVITPYRMKETNDRVPVVPRNHSTGFQSPPPPPPPPPPLPLTCDVSGLEGSTAEHLDYPSAVPLGQPYNRHPHPHPHHHPHPYLHSQQMRTDMGTTSREQVSYVGNSGYQQQPKQQTQTGWHGYPESHPPWRGYSPPVVSKTTDSSSYGFQTSGPLVGGPYSQPAASSFVSTSRAASPRTASSSVT